MKTLFHQILRVKNNDISFLECGEGERVLLFHCSGSQASEWSNFMKHQNQYRCIAPNLTWYGDNQLIPNSKSAALFDPQIVEDFLNQYTPCHVIGHSYGGALLLDALQKKRYQILSATFIEPVSFQILRDKDPAFQEVDKLVQTLVKYMDDNQRILAAKKFINYWTYPFAWEFLDHKIREYMIERIDKIIYEFMPMYTRDNKLNFTSDIDYPVFLIQGQWTKHPAQRIMHYLEESFEVDSEIIPFTGHMSPITKPHAVTKKLLENLNSIGTYYDTDQLTL